MLGQPCDDLKVQTKLLGNHGTLPAIRKRLFEIHMAGISNDVY